MDGEDNSCFNLRFNNIIPSILGRHSLCPSSFSTDIFLHVFPFVPIPATYLAHLTFLYLIIKFKFIYVLTQQPEGQLQEQ
jgi:hypothetical protein